FHPATAHVVPELACHASGPCDGTLGRPLAWRARRSALPFLRGGVGMNRGPSVRLSEMEALQTPLEGAYLHEERRADQIFLTQPIGGGEVREYTWYEAMDEARRMATHL